MFATIIHNFSFSCQLYDSFLFVKSVPNDEVLKDFSLSLLRWLYFLLGEILGRAQKLWFDVYCWGPALKFFVIPARNEFTHCPGFWFLISFLKCKLHPSELLFFLFLIFCILILFWIWHSICFLMVVLMHSWVLSDDLLLYAISFVWRCFDHLFRFSCWFQNDYFFRKVLLVPPDDLDPTLSCDENFISIFELPQILFLVWLKFYVLVVRSVLEVLFLCLQNLLVLL